MKRWVHWSLCAIDEPALNAAIEVSPEAGAVLVFVGRVRGQEAGREIVALEYECFQPMAERQFHLLLDQIAAQWPIESIRLVHRLGRVPINEVSLWVEVIAPHRGEAFTACQWLIDEMKRVVPIWKKPVLRTP